MNEPRITLYYGDILDLDMDAIVNPANTELQHGGSLAAAIIRAGGQSIQEESNRIGWCDLGSAVVTGAGTLGAKHVIHVPTVDYRGARRRASLDEVAQGTNAAIEIARELGARSIAFPLLGTGLAGLRTSDVARTMAGALAGVTDLVVIVCVHWQGDFEAVQDAFAGGEYRQRGEGTA